MHELARALARRSTEQLAITDGRAVARGECRLVVRELVGVGIIVELVERSTMTLTHAGESLICPACDLGNLLGGRRRQGVKVQHAGVIADVHAIERERVEVNV